MTTAAQKVQDQINSIRVLAIAEYQDKLQDFLVRWSREMEGDKRDGVVWAASVVAKSATEPDILSK